MNTGQILCLDIQGRKIAQHCVQYIKIRVFLLPVFSLIRTVQKMNFSIKDLFSKCNQIRSFLRIWAHLLKKFLVENFIFCVVKDKMMNILVTSKLM